MLEDDGESFDMFVRIEVACDKDFVSFCKDVERDLEFLVRECDTVHIECIFSDPYAPGNLVPSFNGNLDVGVDLKLDSPAFFALGDEDVCPDRDITFLCLSGSDKKSDCSHKYSNF